MIGGPLGAIFHQVCFTAGTLVHNGAGKRAIETLRVGQRALTEETKDSLHELGDDPTQVDLATWRLVRLRTAKPAGSDNIVDVEFLRPLVWIEQTQAVAGSPIHFELAELGIDGPACVLAIEPCPEIEPGRGRVITGTFTAARCHYLDLRLVGSDEVLHSTPSHRFFSVDRCDYVPAETLRPGECLRTRSGRSAAVESIRLNPEPERVYNLEVEGEHNYFVGEVGVLVHNTCTTEELAEIENLKSKPASTLADESAGYTDVLGFNVRHSAHQSDGHLLEMRDAANDLVAQVNGTAEDTVVLYNKTLRDASDPLFTIADYGIKPDVQVFQKTAEGWRAVGLPVEVEVAGDAAAIQFNINKYGTQPGVGFNLRTYKIGG